LLQAYDNQVSELEKELEEVYKDLEQIKKASEVVVNENKDLRYQMDTKWREYVNQEAAGHSQLSYGLSLQERELLEDHIDKLSEENNDLLVLTEKLSVRASDATRTLQERSGELEE